MDANKNENPKAFKALAEALKGEVNAQYQLAQILEEEHDYELACGWYQKAAMQGHASAAYRMGMLCLNPKFDHPHEAIYWLQKAASDGHVSAQYNLGIVLEKGIGCRHDPEEALKWHRIAAQRGSAEAKAHLDSMSIF